MSSTNTNNLVDARDTIYPLDNDFRITLEAQCLPLHACPTYLQEGVIFLCLQGHACITVHFYEHRVKPGDLIVLHEGQLVQLTEVGADFRAAYFTVSRPLYEDTISGICRFSLDYFVYMRSHFHYALPPAERVYFDLFLQWLHNRATSPSNLYRRESVIHLLHIFYLELYNAYVFSCREKMKVVDSHKKELAHRFVRLIMLHYKEQREVSFYANKLCITPKYLTTIVKEVSGKSAKDWITDYIMQEIKGLLKHSTLTIQEITVRTHFSNQSALGRFFRQHTGISPQQYRKESL